MAKTVKMSERLRRFADNFIELGNKEQAAIKAGYSERFARGNAHKLVAYSCVKEYIDERLKQIQDESIASAAEVMKYLTAVMRNEKTEEVVVVEGEGEGVSTARKVEKDVSIKDRNKAAELLAKRYGILTDKLQIEDITPVVIGGADELED